MTARPHANFPQFWPQTTMATRRNQLNSPLEQMGLGPRHQTLLRCLAVLEPGFKRYAYPLPACCLLIACSGVLVTICILNEMRLDYSPIYAGFAYKTTEQLWHWRALLRDIVCNHDDAVLVQPELLVPVRCCGRWSETVRAQVAQAGAATRAGCAYRSGSVWAMNVHGCRSSGAALCCGLIHQQRCGHPLQIVVTYALVVAKPCAWAGARRVARW